MCGRFTLTRLADLNLAFPWIKPPDHGTARYNIAPTQSILAARNSVEPRFEPLLWGLVPFWAKDPSIGGRMINARAETLAEKPAFKLALRKRRCIIPADGFYEWRKEAKGKGKTPMYIRLKGGKPFAMAGLWEFWKDDAGEELLTCTVITSQPNDLVAPIHDRMPAILSNDDAHKWLEPGEKKPEELASLLKPYPASEMETFEVSTRVNSPKDDSPDCIEPATSASRAANATTEKGLFD